MTLMTNDLNDHEQWHIYGSFLDMRMNPKTYEQHL